MSDAAAFFAMKKGKKKKPFTFNANLVDADTVSNSVYVDTASSTAEYEVAAANSEQRYSQETFSSEWDDEALAAATTVRPLAPTAEIAVLDMKTSLGKIKDTSAIAEKLRLEETKAQLAAAREGMEREAMKVKEEREKEQREKEEKAKAAAASSTGKWVSARLMSQQQALPKIRMGATSRSQINVQDEELFPDLASADKILEKKGKEVMYKPPKKTAVGGGASWASKETKREDSVPPEAAPVIPSADAPTEVPLDTVVPTEETLPPVEKQEVPEEALSNEESTIAVKKTVTKKKKKDISTFKPGS